MDLKKIKTILEKKGYTLIFRKLNTNTECIQGGIIKKNSDEKLDLDSYFRVLILDQKYYVDFMSQVRTNESFDTIDDVIHFIKKEIPIS